MRNNNQILYKKINFGSTQSIHRAGEAIDFFELGRPVASQIGLEANGAGSKASSGPTHSHPESL